MNRASFRIFPFLLVSAAAALAWTVDPALPTYQLRTFSIPAGARYVQSDGAIRIHGAEPLYSRLKEYLRLARLAEDQAMIGTERDGDEACLPLNARALAAERAKLD